MYKYNERLCSEMAGFFGDAALIFILQKYFPKILTVTAEILHVAVQNLKSPLSRSCFLKVVKPWDSSELFKPKLHGF